MEQHSSASEGLFTHVCPPVDKRSLCLFSHRSTAPAGHPGTRVNGFPIFSFITPPQ